MSTRSVIAEPTPTGWEGVYCHWDGYPSCRAAQLWTTYQELGSASAVREYALRGEWSSFVPPSEFDADGQAEVRDGWITSDGDDCGTEWAYVIEDDALVIFERRFGTPDDDQGHDVGMFGLGASDLDEGGYWQQVGSYSWADQEPEWESVERVTTGA
jgi:hypothetical protein